MPTKISENDDFYLPVDAVITAIFKKLDTSINWNFDKINEMLKENYSKQEIEVWDDLWFWGFITQKGSGVIRDFDWNINKYWVIKETDKNPVIIEEIKKKAKEFIEILVK